MTKQINGLKNDFKTCPMCGSNKIENHGNRKWICPECGVGKEYFEPVGVKED